MNKPPGRGEGFIGDWRPTTHKILNLEADQELKFNKSPLLTVKYTDEMHRWKVEVEENTKLSFWRKNDKRSSDKFALDELITIFLAARIGWRKIERAKI